MHISQAGQQHGEDVVNRYVLLVMFTREGLLESDLYAMLNANSQVIKMLPFIRVSYQSYVAIRDDLDPIISKVDFGGQALRILGHSAFLSILQEVLIWQELYVDVNIIIAHHYFQQLKFLQVCHRLFVLTF